MRRAIRGALNRVARGEIVSIGGNRLIGNAADGAFTSTVPKL